MFYNLLTQYKLGGKFLKLLKNIYTSNKIFVKTSLGLLEPFVTTTGVLQGDILSPLIFNLFINKISEVVDSTCDPVNIGDNSSSTLLWCDDLVVFSRSASGLKNAIYKIGSHFTELGLSVNKTKTKVLIFNSQGLVLKMIQNIIFL